MTIYGSGFGGASAVHFGSDSARFWVDSSSQITAMSPSGSGTVDVTIRTASGTSEISSNDHFSYVAPAPPGSTQGNGYYVVTASGSVFNYGDAHWFGSPFAAGRTSTHAVGLAMTKDGAGYYVITTAGHVFNYGDAHWFGSPFASGGIPFPAVGMKED